VHKDASYTAAPSRETLGMSVQELARVLPTPTAIPAYWRCNRETYLSTSTSSPCYGAGSSAPPPPSAEDAGACHPGLPPVESPGREAVTRLRTVGCVGCSENHWDSGSGPDHRDTRVAPSRA